ncbi:MAG: helix-turn-helix transcriptional regulator [Sphingobium sp.]|nr:helix-turn-helix transcriptional regulator [Sphingobium sp.]
MFDQINQTLEVAVIAARFDMAPTCFSKAFKNSVGIGPYKWHLRRRIVRSAALLYDERRTLAEIACDCGFASQSHYTTAFRRELGVTPGCWRRKMRDGTLRIGDALRTS